MRNYKEYYNLMSANIHEKIDFIVDELKTNDYKRVVDIGCADGQLVRALASIFPDLIFIGTDTNESIIKLNIKNNTNDNIDYMIPRLTNSNLFDANTLVIFSSVLHEMYSFLEEVTILELLHEVSNAKAIAIRDMRHTPIQGYYLNEDIFPSVKYTQFEETREKMTSKEKTEFLLKSQYDINWQEELKENYFATNWLEIEHCFKVQSNFIKVYHKLYINNYLVNKIPQLVKYTNSTHYKVIYKRLK